MTTDTLSSRRHNLSEFRDLFTALFRIADRDVQTRVLDAINGIVNNEQPDSVVCQCRNNRTFVEIGVQTLASIPIKPHTSSKSIQTDLPEDSKFGSHRSTSTTSSTTSAPVILNSEFAENRTTGQNNNLAVMINVDKNGLESDESREVAGIAEKADRVPSPQMLPPPAPAPPMPTRASNIYTKLEIEQVVVRKRKRMKRIPRVEKVDDDKVRIEGILNDNLTPSEGKRGKRRSFDSEYKSFIKPRHDTIQKSNEHITQLFSCFTSDQINQSLNHLESTLSIKEQMKHEWNISLINENGIYPIHRAILDNELGALKRQIYVLKFKKINMHKLVTDEDECPLQLAVKNNSIVPIVEELLKNNADVNELDKDSNTIIHLAMMYSDNPKLLKLLLSKVDYKALNVFNDNGNTALHVAVSEEKFDMCKTLLEFIDEKENLITPGVGIDDKDSLRRLYKAELNEFPNRPVLKLNKQKQNILNAMNRKNGRTPLFLALSNRTEQAELMVLMLLVHLADPHVADFTGMDSISFAMDAFEVNRYTDALDNSVMFFEKILMQFKDLKK